MIKEFKELPLQMKVFFEVLVVFCFGLLLISLLKNCKQPTPLQQARSVLIADSIKINTYESKKDSVIKAIKPSEVLEKHGIKVIQ